MRDSIIAGIDIGSTNIRVVVGQKLEGRPLNIIGLSEAPSEGIAKGVINSIEDAVTSISFALEKAERMTGAPIERAVVSISGSHIISQTSRGVIAVAKADGEIREEDVERVIEAAQAVATPPNYEIIHVIPREYIVDSQIGIRDPIGMTGIRLEASTQIIQGLSSQIKNLTKAIYRTGVDIEDIVLSSIAAAEATLSKRQKELGVAVLNIGGSTTSIAIFEEGDVLFTSVIPVGSSHITSDIAIGLRTSLDTAEEVKLRYGSALSDSVMKKEDIDLSEISEQDSGVVLRHDVAEIIEARVEEIFKLADRELAKAERSGKLPAGIVLSGGGAKLPGLVEVARKVFRLPASIGYPRNVTTAVDKIHDPSLSCGVGLVLWGDALTRSKTASILNRFSVVDEAARELRKWLKSLLP